MSKIQIVDDDETVTFLLTTLLTMEGHQTTTVNDSNEAISVANTFHPDLIILDLMMPGLTGFELCELLRQDPGFASVPVMVVSALDDPESKKRAIDCGANEYLTKPFGVEVLLQRIKDLTGSQNT